MITITKIGTIDEAMYNFMRCPECNTKMGWKPKGERVHIFHLSRPASGKMERMGMTCHRCKANYLITADSD